MSKRSATHELTKDNVNDRESHSTEIQQEIHFRSKEELQKSGKPIIRLKRSMAEAVSPPSESASQEKVEHKEQPQEAQEGAETTEAGPKNDKEEPTEKEEPKIEKSSAPSIFGDLFSRPFSNPFAEAAKSGEANFTVQLSSSSSSSGGIAAPQLFGSSSILSLTTSNSTAASSLSGPQTDDPDSPEEATCSFTPRLTHFPGEESEKEVFAEANAVLLKCVRVDSTAPSEKETAAKLKFKKQGEGLLKILEGKGETPKRRLILRQKGTWSILLNSPLELSKKFEVVPQMTSGYPLRFVGLDNTPDSSNPSTLAAYCLKFDSEAKRQEFLTAAGHSSP